MNSFAQRWAGIAAVALVLPLSAAAQQAFTRGAVNLRAGPSGDYPLVARLAPGQPLEVVGCTSGYGWCDVVLPDGGRGWVWARNLDYAYQDQRVPLATYGAVIGVPIIGFAIGSYWGNYYRNRSWYGDRRWWGPASGRRSTPASGRRGRIRASGPVRHRACRIPAAAVVAGITAAAATGPDSRQLPPVLGPHSPGGRRSRPISDTKRCAPRPSGRSRDHTTSTHRSSPLLRFSNGISTNAPAAT